MSKKVSKGKVIDNLVRLLQLEDYTQLEPIMTRVLDVLKHPIHGVFIVWKPMQVGSLNFSVVGLDVTSPEALQDAARVVRMVADNLSQRALQTAMQSGREEGLKDERGQQRGQTDRIGDAVDTSGDET